jgi:outer membrane protein TolC
MLHHSLPRAAPATGALLVAACAGTPAPGEAHARDALTAVGGVLRPGDAPPAVPSLTPQSPLGDYLRVAMLRSPRVAAAYHAWAAAVERIAVARSQPDPRLTFELDVASMIEALMPGLMTDLPGPGKLRLAGAAATEESWAAYHAFEQEVLRTALAVKSAYYRLHFLEDNLRLQRATLGLVEELEALAQQQNAAGRVTLQDVLRARIEEERVRTEIANLEDSRQPLGAELKSALGFGPEDPDPPIPTAFTPSPEAAGPDELWRSALARNPRLRQMQADVRSAEAMLALARRSGVPDFTLGLEADVRASPVMWRPSVSATLPIWRDKVAAQIAAAQAEKHAAAARLDAEQVALAAELAGMLFAYRESARNIELLAQRLIPLGRQSLESARTAYTAGRAGFLDVIEAERQLLAFETALIDARTRRELALASLSLAIAGAAPEGAPLHTNPSETLTKEEAPR